MLPENGGENGTGTSGLHSPSKSPQPPVENNEPKTNGSVNPLEKIEQLLTCSICLDRYKMPKLLPCHHTFCLPCLESYADTVHHNLKCPECRSEHAVPFEGAKAFPNNLTLAKFLDIHLEATDDNQEQLEAYIQRYNMERCKICDEKAEVEVCAHCDRKACKDCRKAHMEMVKRDLSRLLNQVKRLSNRIKEANACVKKGITSLNENVEITRNEKREEHFLNEVLLYEENETRVMRTLGERLDAEESNLTDACSWVENVLGGELEAKEDELCKFKQSFADGIEYLRNFQPDSDELFSKKIRFSPGDDASKLPQAICNFGELTVYMPQFAGRYLPMEQQYLPRPLRMGMESDSYRTSLRTREEERQSKYGDEKSSSSKAYRRRHTHGDDEWAAIRADRLRRGADSGRSSPNHTPSPFSKSPFLSPAQVTEQCEAAALTAASRSPELLNVEDARPASVSPTITPPANRRVRRAVRDRSSFLVDEVLLSSNRGLSPREAFMQAVEKQTTPTVTLNDGSSDINSSKPPLPRQSESKDEDSLNAKVEKIVEAAHQRSAASSSSNLNNEQRNEIVSTNEISTPVQRRQKFRIICRSSSQNPARHSLDLTKVGDQENGREDGVANGVVLIVGGGDGKEDEKPPAPRRRSIVGLTLPAPGQKYVPVSMVARPIRPSNSTDVEDNEETESPKPPPRPHSSTGFADEMKNATVIPISFFPGEPTLAFDEPMPTTRPRRLFGMSVADDSTENENTNTNGVEDNNNAGPAVPSRWMLRRREKMLRSRTNPDVFGSLDPLERRRLISEANSRHTFDRPMDDPETEPAVTSPSYRRQRFFISDENEDIMLPSTSASSSRRRHESVSRRVQELLNDKELKELLADSTKTVPSITSPTIKNTFFTKDPDTPSTPTERRSRFTRRTSSTRLSLEATPFIDYSSMAKPKVVFGQKGDKAGELNWPRGIATLGGGIFAVADSSNHRIQIFDEDGILKRKFGTYGAMEGQLDSCAAVAYNRISKHLVVSDRYNHRIQLFDLDGRYVRMFGGPGKENGNFNNPWGVAIDNLGMIYVCDKDNHRVQIFDKNGTFMQKFGSKGDDIGQFNHPLFIAIHSKTQNLFVSDSANHRICVMDHNGGPILTFGAEGFSVGQLKLPRGIVIDEQGFVVVADSGNNRVQVFSPDGKFVHGFGVWGTASGQFKGLEGVALLDRRIVVSDRENHRIQIF
ncbi:unnamed protein product [Bursaphelenchus xylophilus]|uniref:(pine wood nematode) hypothetical protein n=1 Tax=Bursaphelenchus xylophilus TaxID=6326 RepID=A0A7I8WI40_BURXY|nr:unnamed protein product [Bursaphelenchus xylophilus]CAG9109130.1 unnamed protein product [Bursaphelenchus xylophilus]